VTIDGRLELRQTGSSSIASGDVVERRLAQLQKLLAHVGEDFSMHYEP
jgi:hypothetical protein